MMYKFSKRRQQVWLKNVHQQLKKAHDTGRAKDYAKYFWLLQQCERYPRIFSRLDYKREEARLARDGIRYYEEVYFRKNR